MKEVAIILLNYNNANDTIECVKSIEENCKLDYKIIIVDNCSSDDSRSVLTEQEHRYKLILNTVNEGFAQGNNVGIKLALDENYKYIMLLNNDTLITKGSIEKLVSYLNEHPDVGIVGPRTMYYPEKEKVWFDGGSIDWFKFIVNHNNMGKNIKELSNITTYEEVDFITGCCILSPADVFEKVGLLPEEYFMYYEDVDFCVRVKDDGYKLVSIKDSIIYHKVSSSSGGEDSPFTIKWGTRNRLIFMNKYKKKISSITYIGSKSFFYVTRAIKLLQYKIRGDKNKYTAMIDGIKDGRRCIKDGR